MKPEMKIGWWVIVGIALAALAVVAIFSAREVGRLHYTIVFKDGKNLQPGDRVQLSGVDIGIVRSVELVGPPYSINVAVRIDGEHAAKVLADSTAIIRNVAIPNVSGQMIVEVYNSNSTPPAPPMQDGSTIKGQEGLIGLKAWQLKGKIGAAGDDISAAVGLASEALGEITGEIQQLATSPEVKQAVGDLRDFLKQMQQQGIAAADQLRAEWPALKARLAPAIEQIKTLGRDYLSTEIEQMIQQIESTLQAWSEQMPRPETPRSTEPTPIPTPAVSAEPDTV